MKNKFLLVLVALFTVSLVYAGRVSQDEAAAIAALFTNEQPQLSRLHKAPRKASDMRLAHKALQQNSAEAAFYVFNQEGNNGFVIVSADDRTAEEVLGYSENGAFDVEKINPNLKWWLSRYAEEITALQTMDESAFEQTPSARKAKQVTAIANLLVNDQGKEITWYQEEPYYNLCPMDEWDNTRSLTGCVATAASQIMYKWRWPKKGTGSSSYTWYNCTNKSCSSYKEKTLSANYGNTTYDWDNMLSGYYGKSATSAQKTAVATLMYHAGVAAQMGYGGDKAGGSGAWTDDMGYGLKEHFGYTFDKFITMYSKSAYENAKGASIANVTGEFSVTSAKFTEYFNADLEAGRPIIMGGEDPNGGGHEFVCCGRDANNKFYINWGWEGEDNGYFALTALKPNSDYNFSTHLDALIGLRPLKKDLPMIDITWSVDGETTTTQIMQEDPLELPATPADCESGKVFVGWTASENVDGDKPADLFTTAAGKTVMEAVTYYAVFAEKEESNVSKRAKADETITLWAEDFSGYSNGDVPSGSVKDSHSGTTVYGGGSVSYSVEDGDGTTKIYEQNLASGTSPELLIAKGDGAFIISGIPTNGATAMTLTFKTNKTSDILVSSTTSGVSVGSVSIANSVATCEITSNGVASLDLTITNTISGSNSREDDFLLVATGASVTYSDYSLTCGAAVDCELTGITLNTDNAKKAFTTGDEFSYVGLVVKANYNNCQDKTVTSKATVTTPNMSVAGEKTVKVSYTEGETTRESSYTITVSDPVTYTITWSVSGVTTPEEYVEGAALVLPSAPAACSETQVFMGWTASSSVSGDKPADLFTTATGNVTADKTYYAVFATVSESNGTAERASGIEVGDKVILVYESGSMELNGITGSSTKYGEGVAYTSKPVGAYLLEVVAGSESGTFALKHENEYLQWSSGNSLSTKDKIDANSSWSISIGGGDATIRNASDNTRLLQWNANSPRFACYTSTQKAVQLYKQGATKSYSNYTLSCEGDPTDVQQVMTNSTVQKVLVGGQLLIMRDGAVYTTTGVRVQ